MKKILFAFIILLPSISSADWLYTGGCGATVEATCLETLNSCNSDGNTSAEITSSELVYLDETGHQVFTGTEGLTPAWANIIFNVHGVDPVAGPYTQYNQRGQCGWGGPACTSEFPYDPLTETCTQPPQFLSCSYTPGGYGTYFDGESGFTSADAAGQALCANVDAIGSEDFSFGGNTGSGVDGNGGDIYTSCGTAVYINFVGCQNITCAVGQVLDYSTNTCVTPLPNASLYLHNNDFQELEPFNPQICSSNDTNSSPPVTTVGNPIDTKDGNKYRNEVDYVSNSISPLNISRYYSSNKNQTNDIGVNWRHSYTSSLTANIHTEATPYVEGDSSFSSLNSTAQLACESGWNDIKTTYTKSELANSTATYLNNTCNIQDSNGNALGSIAVLDNSTGGVSPNPPQDTVVIERANGNTIVFTLVNSVWTAPSDTDVSLVQTATGYTLTTAQDVIEEYNLSGQLVSVTDRKGIQQTLAYNLTSGLLESVSDSFGKSLGFAYTGENISSITLPDTTSLVYGYDASNNLTSVKREDLSVKSYVYEDVRFPNALTGIIDENNQRHMTFTYDSLGRATTSELAGGAEKVIINFIDDTSSTVEDALGLVRTYRFTTVNGEKKLSSIEGAPCTSCGGSNSSYTYDANGYVDSKTDFNGNLTTYVNDARGLPTTLTEAVATKDQRVTTYEWHTDFALPTCVIETSRTTSLTYTAIGSVETRSVIDTKDNALFATPASKTCAEIKARGDYASLNKSETSYTYYPEFGLLKTIDGARTDVNDITTFTYDTSGNLSTISNALGHITELKNYTLRGKPKTLIDANGLTTSITYDVRGRVDLVTVGSQVTNYDFDAVGNLDRVTRPDSSYIDYDYDAAHRLTDIRDQLGNHIHYVLDALGNTKQTDVKDSAGVLKRTSSAIYNQLNQLEKTIGAATQTTDYLLYDQNGNLKHLRDPEGKNTFLGYDALNRLETTTNELTNTSTTVYDAHNNVISVTDLRGLETSYQYDGLGNRTQQNSPDTGITQYTGHDGAGNVLTMVDAKSRATSYQYDVLNRIDLVTYADGTQADYIYDQGVNAKGRLNSVSTLDSTATVLSSNSWGYDAYGHVTTKAEIINGISLSTSYLYNSITGQLESKTTPAGHQLGYGYTNGQVTSLTVDGNIVMNNITYDPFSSANAWVWGNGQAVSRNYNQDGQLDSYTLGQTTFDNNYTLAGNVQTITDLTTPTNQQTFNYDALHRLKDYTSLIGSEAYGYDANSNRTLLADNVDITSDTYVIDTLSNKLSSISGVTNFNYGYDANGNITSKLNLDGIGHTYAYNAQNRMESVSVITAGKGNKVVNTITSYSHNALGQRVSKSTDNTSTLFGYSEQGQLTGVYNQDGSAREEIIYFAGAPVATIRGAEVFYIDTDHLGTPRHITNNTNTNVWSWESDAFGTTAPVEAKVGKGKTAYYFNFNLRFAGQYYDDETGLHYNYFRDYDPSTGRYVQSDPIGLAGGLNTYGYVGGNSLRYIDPYGLIICTGGGSVETLVCTSSEQSVTGIDPLQTSKINSEPDVFPGGKIQPLLKSPFSAVEAPRYLTNSPEFRMYTDISNLTPEESKKFAQCMAIEIIKGEAWSQLSQYGAGKAANSGNSTLRKIGMLGNQLIKPASTALTIATIENTVKSCLNKVKTCTK